MPAACHDVLAPLQLHKFTFLPRLQVECPAAASWDDARACADADASVAAAVDAASTSKEGTLVVVALVPRGGADSTQGAALPGMQIAAAVAAVKSHGCAQQLCTGHNGLAAALEQFGYSVAVV